MQYSHPTPEKSIQISGNISVEKSFQVSGDNYVAKSENYTTSNPAYKIASVAMDRLSAGTSLKLPEAYDRETLRAIAQTNGYPGREKCITAQQAGELSQIGVQLLALDATDAIKPSLGYFETQSITHLVQLVGKTAIRS